MLCLNETRLLRNERMWTILLEDVVGQSSTCIDTWDPSQVFVPRAVECQLAKSWPGGYFQMKIRSPG